MQNKNWIHRLTHKSKEAEAKKKIESEKMRNEDNTRVRSGNETRLDGVVGTENLTEFTHTKWTGIPSSISTVWWTPTEKNSLKKTPSTEEKKN